MGAYNSVGDLKIAPPIRKLTDTSSPSLIGYEFMVQDGRGRAGLAAVWPPERMSLEWILSSAAG